MLKNLRRQLLFQLTTLIGQGAQVGWVSRNGQGQGCITKVKVPKLAKFGQVSRGYQMIWVAVLGGIKIEEVKRN